MSDIIIIINIRMLCYCNLFEMSVSQIIVFKGRMISEQRIGNTHGREQLSPNRDTFMELPWKAQNLRIARVPSQIQSTQLLTPFGSPYLLGHLIMHAAKQ
jgi:hypothetical protein